jgi:hypothetical protein
MSNTISPIVAEALALAPEFFESLIVPDRRILGANTRPFALTFTVSKTGVVTKTLLAASQLKAASAGFVSARVKGPFSVAVVADPGSGTATPFASVVVAVRDHAWAAPASVAQAAAIPDAVVLAVTGFNAVATASLPFPSSFKDNVHVTQNAGLEPDLDVAISMAGLQSVTVVVKGSVELEGVLPLAPY